jgi:hypothetical protein
VFLGFGFQQDRGLEDWYHKAIGTQNGGRSYFIRAWCSCVFAYCYTTAEPSWAVATSYISSNAI